ncbi:cyclic lactone autoinducer peptide [Paenibacillus sp. J2TS4]|nr:cyclic lactone autoinducer peptide [Paenibacillus sp. J2TS4]
MKKMAARYASSVLASCAVVFVAILKPMFHSPKAPKELMKKQ